MLFGPRACERPTWWSRSDARLASRVISTLFTSATDLLTALAKAENDGQLADKLTSYAKPKLLVIDELGYPPWLPEA